MAAREKNRPKGSTLDLEKAPIKGLDEITCGGTITARSTPGKGATFIIALPEKQE